MRCCKTAAKAQQPSGARGMGDWHKHLSYFENSFFMTILKYVPEKSCCVWSPSWSVTGCRSKIHMQSEGNLVHSTAKLPLAYCGKQLTCD